MPAKQATKGQKQIYDENCSTLKFYKIVIAAVVTIYFALQGTLFWETFTWLPILMSISSIAIFAGGYQFMSSMARAKYDGNGILFDAGIDLNMEKGMAEYAKDAIILTALVQLLSLLSVYFWLAILVAPAYAGYVLWVNFLGPWFFSPAPEVNEKKQKKMDRKRR